MPPQIARLVRLLAGTSACIAAGCAKHEVPTPPPPPAVEVAADKGVVMLAAPDGSLTATVLQEATTTTLRPAAETPSEHPAPLAVAGPDARGRVAILDTALNGRGYTLSLFGLAGGASQVLSTRVGDAIHDRPVGVSLALSQGTGKIAFVSGPEEFRPGVPLSRGALEVWDADSGVRLLPPADAAGQGRDEPPVIDRGRDSSISPAHSARPRGAKIVFDAGLAWFADGQRLAVVERVTTDRLPAGGTGPDGFGAAFAGWNDVPAVYIFDTATGHEQFLSIGLNPVLSADGQSIYVSDLRIGRPQRPPGVRWRRIDLGSFEATPIDLPTQGRVLAAFKSGRFLVVGPPQGIMPLPGQRLPLQLRLAGGDADASSRILLQELDPSTVVGFGFGAQ